MSDKKELPDISLEFDHLYALLIAAYELSATRPDGGKKTIGQICWLLSDCISLASEIGQTLYPENVLELYTRKV